MSARMQQLYKSTQRKIDTIQDVRKRLARFERERRMGFEAANMLIEGLAKNLNAQEMQGKRK